MRKVFPLLIMVTAFLVGCSSSESATHRKAEFQNYTKWVSNYDQLELEVNKPSTAQSTIQTIKVIERFVKEAKAKTNTLSPDLQQSNQYLIKWQSSLITLLEAELRNVGVPEKNKLIDAEHQNSLKFMNSLYQYSNKYGIQYTID